jgi:hypothetical protein
MKLWQQQSIFALNVSKLISYINIQNFYCTLGDAYRCPEMAAIYAKEGKGINDSLHCKRLAIDLNLFDLNGDYLQDSKYYEPFGEYWETLHDNNRWGGKFIKNGGKISDPNHFEMRPIEIHIIS